MTATVPGKALHDAPGVTMQIHAIAGMVRRSPSALQQVSLACGTLSRALWTATLVADRPRAEICG